jgi:hypothetical protein
MNLQERREILAKRLEEMTSTREKYRIAFMEVTTKIEQLTGAVSVLDQVISEEGGLEENHGANSKES